MSYPMDLEIIILSEINWKKVSYDIAYMWHLKKRYKLTYRQNRNRPTDIENKLITKGEGGRRGKLGVSVQFSRSVVSDSATP